MRSQHHFGRLVAMGLTAMMFLFVFIDTAMVSVMFACGLLAGVNVYRDAQLPRGR